ncbi:hypothetical protein J3458_021740 [Metarhizium acridum]|uniref:uncharacterized protein n=1 Tax=Metarhizium acridum TaxID=92637 RepID=UPI001C6BCCD8|nr:hypothetical protein J3458_021740 [Metarhizium acridum]
MKAAGLSMPKGRETLVYSKLQQEPALLGQKLAGARPPSLTRPFKQELELLEQGLSESAASSKRLKALRQARKIRPRRCPHVSGPAPGERRLWQELAASSPTEFERANAAWNEKIDNLKKNARNEFNGIKDSYHLFRQSATSTALGQEGLRAPVRKGGRVFSQCADSTA